MDKKNPHKIKTVVQRLGLRVIICVIRLDNWQLLLLLVLFAHFDKKKNQAASLYFHKAPTVFHSLTEPSLHITGQRYGA